MMESGKKCFMINDDYFMCVICTEYWLKRDPRILPCQHIFCKECIEGIWKASGRKSYISCPSCRRSVRWPDSGKDGFPKSRIVSNVSFPNGEGLDDTEEEDEEDHENEGDRIKKESCFMHKKEIELVCLTCSDAKLCRLCWNNHQNHKLMPLMSYNDNEEFREKCLSMLSNAQDQCNEFLDALVHKTKEIENKMAECIQEAKEEILDKWYRKVEDTHSMLVKLQTNVIDKKLFIRRKSDKVNNDFLKIIQEEIENQIFDLEFPNDDLRQVMIDFSDRLFLIMERGSTLEQYIDFNPLINGFEKFILREQLSDNESDDNDTIDEDCITVKSEIKLSNLTNVHVLIEYLNSIYISITETNGGSYLLKLSSRNYSVEQKFLMPNVVTKIFILRNEIFLCSSDGIYTLNSKRKEPVFKIDNVISACTLDDNTIVCLTKDSVRKIRLFSNAESSVDWVIGKEEDVDESLIDFRDCCIWKDKIIVLDSAFSNDNCILAYDMFSSNNNQGDIISFGEYEPAKLGLAKPLTFCYPCSVCSVENELLIVTDCGNKRLQVFTAIDKPPLIVNLDIHPNIVHYSSFNRELYVTEHGTSNIIVLSINLPGY
ncbi:unnamed protein product [Dimorphilus gyrociliatus]|uniref:RING-type domain-containing protein n=1 Tax=Dimorphilus gyrociliatus TaxID=2664684 RepID=A0A7I8W9P5_9ANNE|nr:unnamed protein product [Dimorphilus gyrociliatus]